MKKSNARELLVVACEQATRRMQDWGVPSAGFQVQDCPRSDGLHIEILKSGIHLDSIHVWDEGEKITEAQVSAFMFDLCRGIQEAERFWKGFTEYVDMLRETYLNAASSYWIPVHKEWVN